MPLRDLAGVLVVLAFVALFVGVALLDRRRRAARDAALGRDAVQRGWRYTTSRSIHGRTQRWEGTGLSGAWTAEAAHYPRRRRTDLRVVRWWNAPSDAPPPVAGALILLIAVGDRPQPAILPGDGALARLAQGALLMGLGIAFETRFRGAMSVEGRELQRVDPERTIVDGFAVLSDQPYEAVRRLTPALCEAVRRTFPPGARADGAPDLWKGERPDRPWICLAGDRIAVADMVRTAPDIAAIAALVEAGSALARASA